MNPWSYQLIWPLVCLAVFCFRIFFKAFLTFDFVIFFLGLTLLTLLMLQLVKRSRLLLGGTTMTLVVLGLAVVVP